MKKTGFTLAGATHVTTLQTNAKAGFTLAEVLITLGIIGVVAAMTIPTLIANTNGAKFRSQFKKSISTLNQAGLMGQAQFDFDYAGTNAVCNGVESAESTMTFCSLLGSTLTGYTYVADPSELKRSNNGAEIAYTITISSSGLPAMAEGKYHAFQLADGSLVAFDATAKNCELSLGSSVNNEALKSGGGLASCLGFIDVNGVTLPNKEVTCSDATKTTSLTPETPCAVKNDAAHMTDIFPIVFHDATVEPASNAAKYVLTTSK
ncbi:type II secretion system protein [bacterium]|nr:type II secretion system protein [bacterium]